METVHKAALCKALKYRALGGNANEIKRDKRFAELLKTSREMMHVSTKNPAFPDGIFSNYYSNYCLLVVSVFGGRGPRGSRCSRGGRSW